MEREINGRLERESCQSSERDTRCTSGEGVGDAVGDCVGGGSPQRAIPAPTDATRAGIHCDSRQMNFPESWRRVGNRSLRFDGARSRAGPLRIRENTPIHVTAIR